MPVRSAEHSQAQGASSGVFFDNDNVLLEGHYPDQLSAYRAKKNWLQTLESYFLLEESDDFFLWVSHKDSIEDGFSLRCRFVSTCGRYAFWRITHDQAPEAQALIETAHIPHSPSSWSEIQAANNLSEGPLVYNPETGVKINSGWLDRFDSLLKRLLRNLEQDKS